MCSSSVAANLIMKCWFVFFCFLLTVGKSSQGVLDRLRLYSTVNSSNNRVVSNNKPLKSTAVPSNTISMYNNRVSPLNNYGRPINNVLGVDNNGVRVQENLEYGLKPSNNLGTGFNPVYYNGEKLVQDNIEHGRRFADDLGELKPSEEFRVPRCSNRNGGSCYMDASAQ